MGDKELSSRIEKTLSTLPCLPDFYMYYGYTTYLDSFSQKMDLLCNLRGKIF